MDIASAWFARAESWSQPEQNNEYFLHHRRSGRDPCGRQFSRTAYLKNFLASGGLLPKIGDISELIVDRSGKLEAVVVGAGGFLGIGQRDVAVPYSQINWAYQPLASSLTNNSSSTTGAANTASRNSGEARSFPDHAVLNMTKDQLKAAPAFKFSR